MTVSGRGIERGVDSYDIGIGIEKDGRGSS